MVESKTYRLVKVAKEFNLGISSIRDFLEEKGHPLPSNPNTKISQDLYALLLEEFKGEKVLKTKVEKTVLPDFKNSDVLAIEEKEVRRKKEEKEKTVVPTETPKLSGIKKVSKISLDKLTPKKKVEEKTKLIPKPIGEEVNQSKEPPKVKAPEIENLATTVEKLTGPKVINKIVLKEEKTKTPEDKKLVASSSVENLSSQGKKKKRKRITANEKKEERKKKEEKKEDQIQEKEIQKGYKETLSKLGERSKKRSVKYRREKREAAQEQIKKEEQELGKRTNNNQSFRVSYCK